MFAKKIIYYYLLVLRFIPPLDAGFGEAIVFTGKNFQYYIIIINK